MFGNGLDDIFGGFGRPSDAEKVSLHALRADVVRLRARVSELEGALSRMKRRAQNNIDRAHNRALHAVRARMRLGPVPDAELAARLRVVRFSDEFGGE